MVVHAPEMPCTKGPFAEAGDVLASSSHLDVKHRCPGCPSALNRSSLAVWGQWLPPSCPQQAAGPVREGVAGTAAVGNVTPCRAAELHRPEKAQSSELATPEWAFYHLPHDRQRQFPVAPELPRGTDAPASHTALAAAIVPLLPLPWGIIGFRS